MVVKIIMLIVLLVFLAAILYYNACISAKSEKYNISFSKYYDSAGLPIVEIYNQGIKHNFIVDTGSMQSVINSKSIESNHLHVEPIDAESSFVLGIDGKELQTEYASMAFSNKNNIVYSDVFQVTDLSAAFDSFKEMYGITIDGFLGSSFLDKYGLTLDYYDKKLTR